MSGDFTSARNSKALFVVVFCFALMLATLAPGAQTRVDLNPTTAVNFNDNAPVRWTVSGTDAAIADHPAAVYVLTKSGPIQTVSAAYQSVVLDHTTVTARATLKSQAGTVFDVVDKYSPADNGTAAAALSRTVTVRSTAPGDIGFRSEFAVRLIGAAELKQTSVFIPGIWYTDGRHTPASGMLQDLGRADYLFREDRLPLPLVTVRSRSDGRTLTLIHTHPDGGSFTGEATPATITDDRLKFGSIGVRNRDGVSVVFDDPGVEGDQTRLGRFQNEVRRAERFRPVRVGNHIDDQLLIRLDTATEDDQAVQVGWRAGWTAFEPTAAAVPQQAVYDDSIALLDRYGGDQSGTPGFPFTVNLPNGTVRDISLQMGFVGEQIPCGAFLIADGIKNRRPQRLQKGTAIVDFWADHTLSPAGVPRTWYDPGKKAHWRDYPVYTRVATDGMRGMIRAWRICRDAKFDHPNWLACCRSYGDWLVAHQGTDGSFVRAVDFSGNVVNPSTSATTHPIRFLIDLWRATGDDKYKSAALKAGEFAIQDIGRNCNYFGGTADNDDVTDKEAGWIALDSFLSLYEITDDKKWLDAATRAGTFTETWLYGWNVPIPRDDPKNSLPAGKTTVGMSLIAVGHSGADVFLAFAPFAYQRLAVYTGDTHFAAVARVLAMGTGQYVDVGGSCGYAHPGLVTEATNVAAPRGHGVEVWLPWCTAAVVEPMADMQDAFGTVDIDRVQKIAPESQRVMLKTYMKSLIKP